MEILVVVLVSLWRSFINCATYCVPQSLIICSGIPKHFQMWSRKFSAICGAVMVSRVGMRTIILENRSTTTNIALNPSDSGKPVMRSDET